MINKIFSLQKIFPEKFLSSTKNEIAYYPFDFGHSSWLIVTHGICEYGLRHQHLLNLAKDYYNICFYDLAQHGFSSKKPIHSFQDFTLDLIGLIEELKTSRYSLFGHSMGGLITLNALHDLKPEKTFISCPPLDIQSSLKFLLRSPSWFLKLFTYFHFSLGNFGVNGEKVSHDHTSIRDYDEDPLINKYPPLSLFFHLLQGIQSYKIKKVPHLYFFLAEKDLLINHKKVLELFPEEKTFIYKNAYHEIHFEIPSIQKEYFKDLTNLFKLKI